jgi:hypothetical protein
MDPMEDGVIMVPCDTIDTNTEWERVRVLGIYTVADALVPKEAKR